jgi:hypothetical protein
MKLIWCAELGDSCTIVGDNLEHGRIRGFLLVLLVCSFDDHESFVKIVGFCTVQLDMHKYSRSSPLTWFARHVFER